MTVVTAEILIDSLYDKGHTHRVKVPGPEVGEILLLLQHDYDDVDRVYVEHETQGGE